LIVVPDILWERLLDLLLEPSGKVERVGFIDGVVTNDLAVATTVVVPNATLHRRFYDVSAAAMSEAGKHLRRHRLQRLAQVHTHEGSWAGHSPRDDALAYSRDDGSISIVVPYHAKHRPRLTDCGIHRCESGSWRQLTRAEVDALFQLAPSTLSFRRPWAAARERLSRLVPEAWFRT
jgi:hypothetical protein